MSKKPANGKASKDQHTSNRMVRLPVSWHELLKAVARKNDRPVTWELKVALRNHFLAQGMEPPAEAGE